MKNTPFNQKKNNKPHFDKAQSRAKTPPRVQSRGGQFGRGNNGGK